MSRKFDFVRCLGEGAFGKVYLISSGRGSRKQLSKYALKVTDIRSLGTKARKGAVQEVDIMKMLNHPHILTYFTSFEVDGALCIVTDYCSNGDMSMLLQNRKLNMMDHEKYIPEASIIEWFKQIASALQYLHEIPILHRDVKTSNIFLTDDFQTKLGDFGLAKVLERPDSKATTYCGSIYYMSPEILSGKPYDQKSDIWALGVVMYEIVTLNRPFDALLTYQIAFQILHETLPDIHSNSSTDLCNLISQTLNKDHDQRPSASKILTNKIFKPKPHKQQTNQHICPKIKDDRKTEKHEKYSGPFDMANILGELSKIHDFDQKRDCSVTDILKHIVEITKGDTDIDKTATNYTAYKSITKRQNQNQDAMINNQKIKKDECVDTVVSESFATGTETKSTTCSVTEGQFNVTCEADVGKQITAKAKLTETCDDHCKTNKKSGLEQKQRRHWENFRQNYIFKVGLSQACSAGVNQIECDGCCLVVPISRITQVKARRYCRVCLNNGYDDNQSNRNGVKDLRDPSNKECAIKDSLQPTNDFDGEDILLSKTQRKVTTNNAIDSEFERQVLTNIKHARDSRNVRIAAPVSNEHLSECHDNGKSEVISDSTKERLQFVYKTVDDQEKALENNQLPNNVSQLNVRINSVQTLSKKPKSEKRVRDVVTQIQTTQEHRLAFLNKMRQGR